MASLDLTGVLQYPAIANTTLSGSAGNVRLILLPPNIDLEVTIRCRSAAGKLVDPAAALAEDAAISSSAYRTLPADTDCMRSIRPNAGVTTLTIAGGSSGVVEVELNRPRRTV